MGNLQEFNINEIIEKYTPDIDELSRVLFPNVQHPKLAFNRILKNEAELSVSQLEKLAQYLGTFVGELFTINSFNVESIFGVLYFKRGQYTVTLGKDKNFINLYDDGKLIDKYIVNIDMIPFSDFILKINSYIKHYEQISN